MTDRVSRFAICRHRRFGHADYWNEASKSWGWLDDCTLYTQEDRDAATLPRGGTWTTVFVTRREVE